MKTTRYAKLLTSPLGPTGSLKAHLRQKLDSVLARPHLYASSAAVLSVLVLTLLEALDYPGDADPIDPNMFKLESVENRWLRYAGTHKLRDRKGRPTRDFDKTVEGLRAFAAQEYARESP